MGPGVMAAHFQRLGVEALSACRGVGLSTPNLRKLDREILRFKDGFGLGRLQGPSTFRP